MIMIQDAGLSVVWDGLQSNQLMAPAQLWAGPTGEGRQHRCCNFKKCRKEKSHLATRFTWRFISKVERRGRDRSLGTRVVEGGGERESEKKQEVGSPTF